jgi:flagellar basal-body rod protein FlgB
MGARSIPIILKALEGLTARSQATAQNIANAQSPAYAPLRVRFEEALAQAAERGGTAVRAVRPQFERASGPEALEGVRLDQEIVTAAMTAGRYAALLEILNRQFQIEAASISGGQS